MIEASAPGKIILLGEHAVVYGQPAIAVPVSGIRATACIAHDETLSGLRIIASELDMMLPENIENTLLDNALLRTVQLTLQRLQSPPPRATLTIRSDIPIASGLGSGAAVATSMVRVLSAAVGKNLPEQSLNELVFEIEKLHHGTPSGIDNTVVVYERPIFYVRGTPITHLTIGKPFTLLIADTGRSALTRVAISDVRRLYDEDTVRTQAVLTEIGRFVYAARDAIGQGDLASLGTLMSQNHDLLKLLTVSSIELDKLVETALDAGALGAKLSGGGRGGNMIALVTEATAESVMTALRSAGAVRVISTTVA